MYTTDVHLFKIRYITEVQTLFALGQEGKPLYERKIYVSRDEGYSWKPFCTLTFSAQGLYFFNKDDGYAWTSSGIYGTSDGGLRWQRFAITELNFLITLKAQH